jgi:hypothetical protein
MTVVYRVVSTYLCSLITGMAKAVSPLPESAEAQSIRFRLSSWLLAWPRRARRVRSSIYDVATARWVAKTLHYPNTNPQLSGRAWPWSLTVWSILIAGAAVAGC